MSLHLNEEGIPVQFRSYLWDYLIGNDLMITKDYFYILYKKALKKYKNEG